MVPDIVKIDSLNFVTGAFCDDWWEISGDNGVNDAKVLKVNDGNI